MEFGETKITLAATDSFRLSEAVIKLDKAKVTEDYKTYLAKNQSVIVPARTLSEVIRAISAEDENVKVYLAENQIFFETADVLFVSRLIDGKYPEYKQVVPKEFSMNIDREKRRSAQGGAPRRCFFRFQKPGSAAQNRRRQGENRGFR